MEVIMLRGLYTAATGLTVQRAKMDVITNNIVNADTTGYKQDDLISSSFEQAMIERIGDPNVVNASEEVGPYSFGTHIDEIVTDFSVGNFEDTGLQTDLAISGNGFFVVETPDGERYTRSGDFTVNAEGYLVTGDGYYALGNNGPINVGSGDFFVDESGNVTARGELADKMQIVAFEDTSVLRKQGDNLYYSYGGGTPEAAGDASVMQGYLESSNVDIATEMVDMITVYRAYEASQKILTMTDETLGLAVNNIGSVS